MKKLMSGVVACLLLSACSSTTTSTTTTETPVTTSNATTGEVVPFSAHYEMFGTTSAGLPKNDTFIFDGETTDGIITSLTFDIIRNQGSEDEISKKDIYGYQMNISDAVISETDGTFALDKLSANSFAQFPGGDGPIQYMASATCASIDETTTFKDLTVTMAGETLDLDSAIVAYQYLANEAGITDFSGDTLLTDLIAPFGLVADGSFVAGENRVSFAGYHGGRSYGEQMDAIVDYILANNMTLEDVYEMFQTVNQQSTPIDQRDTVSGATIAFVGDFQRMVYLAIHGELFEGVVTHSESDGVVTVEVVTQGYGGEIETHVSFDWETSKIVGISIRDAQETEGVGAVLTAEDSEFIQALIAGQDDLSAVETVSGATVTSNALIKAVQLAQEYFATL